MVILYFIKSLFLPCIKTILFEEIIKRCQYTIVICLKSQCRELPILMGNDPMKMG